LGRPTVFLSGTKKTCGAGLLSSFRRDNKAIYGASQRSSFRQPRKINPPRAFFIGVGNGFLLIALIGIFLTLGPLFQVEIGYRLKKEENLQAKIQTHFSDLSGPSLQGDALETQSVKVPNADFSLVIPKINAASMIIPNVNAGSEKEYNAALKKGIAHGAGTVFPGMKGTIFLFAHSTDAPWNIARYNAIFYLLRELEPNDQIIVYFLGAKHYYSVYEKKIVDPKETSWFNQKDEEILVLQTCYPPGTTKNALLIFAKPV